VNAIVERFDRLWRDDPRRPLLHLPSLGTTLTADNLQQTRRAYGAVLAAAQIGDGHLIVSVAGNRSGFLPLLLAAWNLDAAVIPVDEDIRDEALEEVAAGFGAAAIVQARGKGTRDRHDLDDLLGIEFRPRDTWRRHPGLALLKLTSGSTGTPKAVGVPAVTMINDTEHITEALGIRPGDAQIGVIPLSHAYGFGNLVLPLLLQGTAIVLREAFVPQAVVADARTYSARVMPGVPFMFQHFAAHPPPDGWPPSLTLLISAGARLSPEVIRGFWDRFGVKVRSMYGTSEAGVIAFDHGDTIDGTASVGWPLRGVTVELRDDDDVPDGYGRVFVRSSAVAPGYVTTQGLDSQLLDGFLTGDYGLLAADGQLVLAGRVSSFINVAGRKVQPAEIEQHLRAIPGVIDARVLAAADPVRGEQVAAVIAGNGTLSRSDIRQFCVDRLPPHKVPRVIVVVPAMPLTARGKPDTRALQALVDANVGQSADRGML
jgi:acyl-CoA synthetase (AMP-forming)/AMP-acid ligase II